MSAVSHGVISVVREIIESDTVFFRTAVALPEPHRTRVLSNRARMTDNILSIMRILVAPPVSQPRFVVNIPLRQENFEDVLVTPSSAQLEAACEHDIAIEDGNCAICQESVTVATRLRNCSHTFHRGCITNWFGMSSRCPVCRDDVRVQRPADPPGTTPSGGESH